MKLRNTFGILTLTAFLALAALVVTGDYSIAEAGKRDRDKQEQRDRRDRRGHRDNSRHGDIITETRDVADFTRVKIRGIANVEITFGSDFFVEVEAGEDVIEYLETNVSGKTLEVGLEDHDWEFNDLDWDFDGGDPLLVRITMPKLEELRVKGIGSVYVDGFEGDELEVSVSGVGEVKLEDFNGKLLDLSLSGVSDVEVDGECDELNVTLSGVGEADLRRLKARDVYAKASGMGDLRVFASERLDAHASGFGDIYYYGNPDKVDRDERGFGDIVAKR